MKTVIKNDTFETKFPNVEIVEILQKLKILVIFEHVYSWKELSEISNYCKFQFFFEFEKKSKFEFQTFSRSSVDVPIITNL